MKKPKWSICSTNYNTEPVLEKHLESIRKFINPEDFEIVIVDNKSKDGSLEILQKFANEYGNMKVISRKCFRGLGRQIAFEQSSGEYIVATDCDTIYWSQCGKFIKEYERRKLDFGVQAPYIGIIPRKLLEKVGGWRTYLDTGEDYDLWARLLNVNGIKWYPLLMGENWWPEEAIQAPERRVVKSLRELIYRYYYMTRGTVFIRGYDNTRRNMRPPIYKPLTYYSFWLPLLNIARVHIKILGWKRGYEPLTRADYEKNIIDLGIDGKWHPGNWPYL